MVGALGAQPGELVQLRDPIGQAYATQALQAIERRGGMPLLKVPAPIRQTRPSSGRVKELRCPAKFCAAARYAGNFTPATWFQIILAAKAITAARAGTRSAPRRPAPSPTIWRAS